MMKRIALCLLLVGLLASPAMAGAKRMKDYSGSLTLDLLNSDTATEQINKILITSPKARDKSYDLVMGYLYVGDAVVTGGGADPDSLGTLDSVIITVITGWGVTTDTLKVDVLIPPDTCVFEYWADYDYVQTGTNTPTLDSTGGAEYVGGVWVPTDAPSPKSLYYDHLWFTAYGVDTTGALDSLAFTIQYQFRFIERED